jgi:protoporphyrinogen/coproporphyrinogen III oxidase
MRRIVIVGAGISGLALAHHLTRLIPDSECTILEAENRSGGKIWTDHDNGFLVESGPNGFLESKPSTLKLCRDLGIESELVSASESSRRHRFLFLDGKLRELPSGPRSLATTRLLSWRGKIGLARELFRPAAPTTSDESVSSFFRRRLGREAAAVFGDALVTGIHGGDPDLLSAAAAFPRAAEMERKHGSVIRGFMRTAKMRKREALARGEPPPQSGRMWSFRAGLRRLIEALIERLPRPPIQGAAVRRIERVGQDWSVSGEGTEAWPANAVVLACPADRQARILADLDGELAADIEGIASSPIAVVSIGYRKQDVPNAPDGFGFIAPQNTRRDLLGVQWCSAIYPDRAPTGCVLWRALCGGWNRGEVVGWDDDRLLAAVRAELRVMMGVEAAPIFHRILRWERAIPQYHVGHLERVARIETRVRRHRGLFLAGNAYHGVAMNDCTEQAPVLAGRIAEYLNATADSSKPSAGVEEQ